MKLRCDELLSNFAFKFNLRRYMKACAGANVTVSGLKVANRGWRWEPCAAGAPEVDALRGFVAGAYTRPLFRST